MFFPGWANGFPSLNSFVPHLSGDCVWVDDKDVFDTLEMKKTKIGIESDVSIWN